MKDRLFQNDDDEEQRYSADLGGEEETGTCTCRRAYSSERKLFNIPLARAFSLIVTIICFCGGVNFARCGLCTAGMKAIVGIALTVATIFTIYAIYDPTPHPLTFSFGKAHGLPEFLCAIFVLFHGILVGVVAALLAFSIVINVVSFKDFISWSCFDDDDDDKGGPRS